MKKCQSRKEVETNFLSMDPAVYEQVDSCNKQNCLTSDTMLVIVGTLTPSGGKGYFYTAPRNRIYGYIDAARDTKLVYKKMQLQNPTLSEEDRLRIIGEIKEELQAQKIAFLDVVECAIRKKDSYADKDIRFASLDYNSFTRIPKTAKVICNSKLAESCYSEISANIGTLPAPVYLSQRNGTKASWLKELV